MKITIDIDYLDVCSSYASRSLGVLDYSKKILDYMNEDWPDVEDDISSVEHALGTLTTYLEQLCETIRKAEREGLYS